MQILLTRLHNNNPKKRMSISQPTSLSLPTRLLSYLGPPSTILLLSLASPKTALVAPLSFLPPAYFFSKWRKSNASHPSRHAGLEPLIWTFAAAGTLGLAAVAGLQLGICKSAGLLIFYGKGEMREEYWGEFWRGEGEVEGLAAETIARRAELAGSWQGWVFNAVFTFVAAGMVEETIKFLPVAYARWQRRRSGSRSGSGAVGQKKKKKQGSRVYLDYVLSAALSFGVVESIAFLYDACEQGHESWSKLGLTLFERIVLGQLGHLSVAALTALRATRSDYGGEERMSWWEIIRPAVLLHGGSNFAAMAASAVEGNVGWVHPTGVLNLLVLLGVNLGLNGVSVWQVRKEWRALKERERNSKDEDDESIEK